MHPNDFNRASNTIPGATGAGMGSEDWCSGRPDDARFKTDAKL
jgi:hypothetical protein